VFRAVAAGTTDLTLTRAGQSQTVTVTVVSTPTLTFQPGSSNPPTVTFGVRGLAVGDATVSLGTGGTAVTQLVTVTP
jgi:hypothetical protein